MGAAFREAWLWLILAFVLGLAIGYLARQRPMRAQVANGTDANSRGATGSGSNGGARSGSGSQSGFEPGEASTASIVALEASAPSTVVVPAKVADTAVHADDAVAETPSSPAGVATKSHPVAKAPRAKPTATKPTATKPKPAASASRKRSAKPVVVDLAEAKTALGVTVKLDDLKLIEGIGPKIEALFKADGVTTWRELSKANVERLQGILDAAGPRYKVHNPGSWPKQAGLLADGKWAEFKTLTDKLKGGR